MNKAILNESLLEKDIEKITFYASEEKKVLNSVFAQMNEFGNDYASVNFSAISNTNNILKSKIDFIYEKRMKYIKILNRVIKQYRSLSKATVKKIDKGV